MTTTLDQEMELSTTGTGRRGAMDDAMAWMARSRAEARTAPRFGRVRSLTVTGDDPDNLTTESAPRSVNLVVSPGRPWRLAALGRGHSEAERAACLPACVASRHHAYPWVATSWTQRGHVKDLWMVVARLASCWALLRLACRALRRGDAG